MFDQDPNEQARISGADLAIMIDERHALRVALKVAREALEFVERNATGWCYELGEW